MPAGKYLRAALIALACAAGVWLVSTFALPVLLPFVIGLAVAAVVEKPLRLFLSRTHLPRALGSFLFVLAFYALLTAALAWLLRVVLSEASELLQELPELAASLAQPLSRLRQKLYALAERLPDGIGAAAREAVQGLFTSGAHIGTRIYDGLFSLASDVLGKLPDIFLFLVTTVVASFFSAAELPKLRGFAASHLPERWQAKLRGVSARLRRTLGGYVQAQLKLMAITFVLLTLGFLVLRLSYPLLLGLILAVVDALPVFGTGTVLIPWSLLLFLRGEVHCGAGLLILYGVTALARQALEPRLLGRHIGLDPLLTLMALYVGFRCAGLVGMLLFPLAAILLRQLLTPESPR